MTRSTTRTPQPAKKLAIEKLLDQSKVQNVEIVWISLGRQLIKDHH
jgi:hypothetical protein